MKILVRVPNWLGDMVMSVGALQQLPHFFPGADVGLIVKKGLHELLDHFPPHQHRFVFSKEEYRGPIGLWRFGNHIRRQQQFDAFISLPDSFSAALMGYATGTKQRVGYRHDARRWLLTHSYTKPTGLHRVDEYLHLLSAFSMKPALPASVRLQHKSAKQDYVVININSEADSRRLPETKAVEVISAVREQVADRIVLIGGPREQPFVEQVFSKLPIKHGIESLAGRTRLPELVSVLAGARAVLTTDSGPAHLSNALGTQTVVLFGAGSETNTGPYEQANASVVRLGKLSCEPCTKNTCLRFGVPQCLEQLDTQRIISVLQAKWQRHA